MTAEIIPQCPFNLFDEWLEEARENEINDPDAMAVACMDENGRPSVRMVLMRKHDARGFCFFTNWESEKSKGLLKNPDIEACFHWKSTRKQIRIFGQAEKVSETESDAYAHSRKRKSQISAWASKQSRPMENFKELMTAQKEMEERFQDEDVIPRPQHWGGFRIVPGSIEFWESDPHRLHKRFVYLKNGDGWDTQWLYP